MGLIRPDKEEGMKIDDGEKGFSDDNGA